MAPLEEQIQKVRELRAVLESRTQELHEQQVAFNQQHKDLIEAKCKAASDCAHEEARLRELTMTAYAETGNKKPAEGVGIRMVKCLRYVEAHVKDWAMAHDYGLFLELDRAGFQAWYMSQLKAKKELPSSMDEYNIVIEVVKEPQPTIARDL